jgi:hypothetical protein
MPASAATIPANPGQSGKKRSSGARRGGADFTDAKFAHDSPVGAPRKRTKRLTQERRQWEIARRPRRKPRRVRAVGHGSVLADMKRLLILLLFMAWPRCQATELETLTIIGNPQTFGVDFQIDRPKGWFTRDTPLTGGMIASYWSTPKGLADNFQIIVAQGQKIVPHEMTKEEFSERFENTDMATGLERAIPGAKRLRKTFLPEQPYPTGRLNYTMTAQTPDGPLTVSVTNYIVFLKNVMVEVQFYLPITADLEWIKKRDLNLDEIVASLRILPSRP